MSVAELKTPPLRISVRVPTLLVARQRKNIGPANRFLAPAEGLSHRLPHGNHDRRQDQVVGRANQVLSILALRLRVAQLNKCCRSRTDDIRLATALHYFINCLAGSHRKGVNKYSFAVASAMVTSVERVGDLVNPFLFLGAVGEG